MKFRRLIIIFILSTCLAVIAYSVVLTSSIDSSSIPLMTALTIALLVILVAIGKITSDLAGKGLVSLFKLLPDIISWCIQSNLRTTFFSLLLIVFSVTIYFLGPRSIHSINILSGRAEFVILNEEHIPTPSSGWLSKKIWSPGDDVDSIESKIYCLIVKHDKWRPDNKDGQLDCGDGLRPSLISNGIDISNINLNTISGNHITVGVKRLKKHLSIEIPKRNLNDNILIATWNIKTFGTERFRLGNRLDESFYYIAEVISHFDIVAIQEVQTNTQDIFKLMDILGTSYGIKFSLVSPGNKGNNERMAFIFDKRKIKVGPLFASIVINADQLARVPYVGTFDVNNKRLTICSVHIYYGKSTGKKREKRINEIKDLSKYLVKTKKKEPEWAGPLILLGDFNAPSVDSPEINELKKAGFYLDPDLVKLPTNPSLTQPIDQIAFLKEDNEVLIGGVGVFNYFNHVYRTQDESIYRANMGESYLYKRGVSKDLRDENQRKQYYNKWRSYQMSDHFPKWVELQIVDN